MSEVNDYKCFKSNVSLSGDRIDRVENIIGAGMPDVSCCFDGVEFWIELKSPTEPLKATTPLFGSNHKVSQDQANWFLRQRKAGGNAFFLIVTDKRWMLLGGHFFDIINKMTVDDILESARWATEKPVRDKKQWLYLRQALLQNLK